ncbi:MAG TPA: hypothetical protein VGH70_09820 [Bradyrhizobium sp.]
MRELEAFRTERRIELSDAGDIAAGVIEVCYKSDLHGIAGGGEHHGNGVGSLFRGDIGRRIGDDHRDLVVDEIGGQRRQPAVIAFGPAVFDGDVLAVDKAAFLQALAEGRDLRLIFFCRRAVDQTNYGHRLLGARHERH